jgi:hypothetical protein
VLKGLISVSQVFQVSNDTDRNRKVDPIAILKEMLNSGINPLDHDHNHQHISSDGFFCSSPSKMNVWLKPHIFNPCVIFSHMSSSFRILESYFILLFFCYFVYSLYEMDA